MVVFVGYFDFGDAKNRWWNAGEGMEKGKIGRLTVTPWWLTGEEGIIAGNSGGMPARGKRRTWQTFIRFLKLKEGRGIGGRKREFS